MKFTDRYTKLFQWLLPSPFAIALILTIFTFLIALFFSKSPETDHSNYILDLVNHWQSGLWNNGLMVFAMQMMLMLVLGHVLALSQPINAIIDVFVKHANNSAKAAFLVSFLTIMVAYFNWGLGLIFGAIFTRKIGEYALKKGISINYPLVGAAGYVGLMVWHGGISGSALIKVAEKGHLKSIMAGIISEDAISSLPEQIGLNETVFSPMNLTVSVLILILVPTFLFYLAKKSRSNTLPEISILSTHLKSDKTWTGAEKIDHHSRIGSLMGLLILFSAIYLVLQEEEILNFRFITPNLLNLVLLGMGLLLHGSLSNFLTAVDQAISGAAGILIQFPLYFGIMGIMKGSGMVQLLSDFFVSISNETSFPIFTMLSAGIVNIFVPSGGGQWAVQGPIIIQACQDIGVSLPKAILALAYGDQLTNMLQPFWALPLLGITGLKAKQILPYTLMTMLVGGMLYLFVLLLF